MMAIGRDNWPHDWLLPAKILQIQRKTEGIQGILKGALGPTEFRKSSQPIDEGRFFRLSIELPFHLRNSIAGEIIEIDVE